MKTLFLPAHGVHTVFIAISCFLPLKKMSPHFFVYKFSNTLTPAFFPSKLCFLSLSILLTYPKYHFNYFFVFNILFASYTTYKIPALNKKIHTRVFFQI